jgi:hypothetical protein
MSQLILTNCVWVIDLVTENNKWDLGELLHRKKGIEFGFRFWQTFVVLCVDKEDDSGDFWEVILPETTGWSASAAGSANGFV